MARKYSPLPTGKTTPPHRIGPLVLHCWNLVDKESSLDKYGKLQRAIYWFIVAWWRNMASCISVNIGPENGLSPIWHQATTPNRSRLIHNLILSQGPRVQHILDISYEVVIHSQGNVHGALKSSWKQSAKIWQVSAYLYWFMVAWCRTIAWSITINTSSGNGLLPAGH